jgi:molecular chaperone DnaK (HSP70)
MNDNSKEVKTVDFGIDLGRENAIIARWVEDHATIIPNMITQKNYTPSAVALDEDGNAIVGDEAKRQSLYDPENVATEFKFQIGSDKTYHFKDAEMDLTAEELTAKVLNVLKNSAIIQTGEKITSAVITVPCDFNPIQFHATIKAAELAGLEFTPIIMEPVAAAYAYSNPEKKKETFLVYTFGESGFDASIIYKDDSDFMNLADSNDNFLNENLIDWDIVYKIFAKKVRQDLGLDDFNEKNKARYMKQFARLKIAAEKLKNDLSNSYEDARLMENFLIDDYQIYDFKYPINNEAIEQTNSPLDDEEFMNLFRLNDEKKHENMIDMDIAYKTIAKKIREDKRSDDFDEKRERYMRQLAKLKIASEKGEKKASDSYEATIFIENFLVHDMEIYDFKCSLKMEELEEIMNPYIQKTLKDSNDTLKISGMAPGDIDYVILVGNTSINPIVRENLKNAFGIPLRYDIDPTTVVAQGAARFAGTIPQPN